MIAMSPFHCFCSFLMPLKLPLEILIVRRVGVMDTLWLHQLSSRYSFGVVDELGPEAI